MAREVAVIGSGGLHRMVAVVPPGSRFPAPRFAVVQGIHAKTIGRRRAGFEPFAKGPEAS
jgi:hypothetical protein